MRNEAPENPMPGVAQSLRNGKVSIVSIFGDF